MTSPQPQFSLDLDDAIDIDVEDGVHTVEPQIEDDDLYMENILPPPQKEDEKQDIPRSKKFLYLIGLREGIKKRNFIMLYIVAGVMVAVVSFVWSMQPYLVQYILHVPTEDQGEVVGDIGFWVEIVILCLAWIFGTLSDRMGTRKPLIVIGAAMVAVSVALLTFSTSVLQLIFIRIFGGIGSTMCMSMVGPSSADYTLNRDRGKAMAVGGLFNGGGAVFTLLVFLKVPQWITDTTSLDVYQAGIITFTMISMLSLFAAFGSIFFIHDGAIFLQEKQPTTHSEDRTRLLVLRDTSSPSTPTELGDQFELEDGDEILKQAVEIPEEPEEQEKGCFGVLVDGITSGRDPIVLLSYCASFIGRGDATIITTFIAIWVSQEVLAAGGSQTEALSQAGLVTGITQTFALVTGPIFGVLVDRVNRVVILALVAIISFIGYTSIYLLTSVTSGWVYLSIMLIGAGEGGAFLVGQTLVTQAAPKESRGSVIGAAAILGNLGVLFVSKVGGSIYRYNPAYPFVLMGLLNGILFVISIFVLVVDRKKNEAERNRMQNQLQIVADSF